MNLTLRANPLSRACVSASIAGALLAAAGAAQAAYLVDTGEPTGTTQWLLGGPDGGGFQYLGGSFTLAESNTISLVEGWIETSAAGDVVASLWAGAPSVLASPLYSAVSALAVSPSSGWEAFGGLDWSVGPGTYTLTFSPLGNYSGGMFNGAPAALDTYYFINGNIADWAAFSGLGIGVRVTAAVPEPQTYALMLAGLAAVAWAARRRR